MPVTIIERSPHNSVAFVSEEHPRDQSFNTYHTGQAWEVQTLPFGTRKAEYRYKAEITDPIELQFHLSIDSFQGAELQLIQPIRTPTGSIAKVLHTWPADPLFNVTNNTKTVDGVVYDLITAHFKISPADYFEIKPGLHYLRFKATYSEDGINDEYAYNISEPIQVARKHHGTILLKGRHSTNQPLTIHVQTEAVWPVRVEGALHSFVPDFVNTSSTNQPGVVRQLYSRTGSQKTLTVGGGQGVSDWIKAVTNEILNCSYKEVDGLAITLSSDAQWEDISTPGYPLGGQSIAVRLGDPSAPYSTVKRPSMIVYPRQNAYPYFVHTVSIQDVVASNTEELGTGFYVKSKSDEQKMLLELKRLAVAVGLKGYFTYSFLGLQYFNGAGENYTISASIVLPFYMEVGANVQTADADLTIQITGTYAAVVWNETTYEKVGAGVSAGFTPSHNYPAGQFKAKVFHNNTITEIGSNTVSVNSMSGQASNALIAINLNSTSIAAFDIAFLLPAAQVFESLGIRATQLATLSNTVLFTQPASPFPAFYSIDIRQNKLSTTVVSDTLVHLEAGVATAYMNYNGFFKSQQQTPVAPPNFQGSTAKASLIANYSWSVTTD